MKVLDLSGREHQLKFLHRTKPRLNTSKLHEQARSLLQEQFPFDNLFEEVSIPGEQLTLDFFLPHIPMAVEVHGEQHYRFVGHFHGDVMGFVQSKKRDSQKREWCTINNIELVELKYDEPDRWRTQISRGS